MHLFVWLRVRLRAVKRQKKNPGYWFRANSWQRMAQPMGLKAAQLADVQSNKSPASVRTQREGLNLKPTITSKQKGPFKPENLPMFGK